MSTLIFGEKKFLSVRNEDPGLARSQNAKNGTEYASNGDFKKFQAQSENFGRSQFQPGQIRNKAQHSQSLSLEAQGK